MVDKQLIEELKRRVPSIPSVVTMSKESVNSFCGPCPKCGGKDRFVYKTDSGKAFCRHCHPEVMDDLDFQKWHYGKSIQDLLKEYMPEYNPNQVQNQGPVKPLEESPAKKQQEQTGQGDNPEMQESWDNMQEKHTNREPVYDLFARRGLSKKYADKIFEEGMARGAYYADESSVAFAFKTLEANDVLAIQYQTVSGQTYSFTEKYSKAANKVLKKGSKLGADCFFICGTKPEDAKKIFTYESVINALTGYFCLPDACHIAIGSTSCIKKLKALKPYKHIEEFILCFDNDPAGEEATKKAAKILGARSRTAPWPKCYRQGYDINDKLKAGDIKGIVDLLINAVKVEIKKQPEVEQKKTNESKQKEVKEEKAAENLFNSKLPVIVPINSQLRDVRKQCWSAIHQKNDENPVLFSHSLGIVMVGKNSDEDDSDIKQVTRSMMRGFLTDVADFYATVITDDSGKPTGVEDAISPPTIVCDDLLADQNASLPYLKGFKYAPFFMKNGTLHHIPGYSEESQYILVVSPGIGMPCIVDDPTAEDIKQARLLIYEFVADFPFTSAAEKAHAIALMILPFVREMIDGQVPLHLVEASTPGTGKTKLVTVLTYIFLGQIVSTMTEGRNDDEWRKKLTAKLKSNPAVIFIDNVRYEIDSAPLAAVLTSGKWEDRILGKTEIINLLVNCLFIATGNNPSMSSEIARRTIRIRLDARLDRPWERGAEYFKHPDLMGWTKKHRGELIGAVLTLAQAWISAGRPAVKGKRLGGFEAWSDVLGGILSVAGIPGFLENLNDFYEDSDSEGSVLRSLISAWYRTFGGAEIGVSDIFHIVIKNEIPVDIGEKSERSQKTKLGQLLRQLKGRRFTIETETEDGGKENSLFQVTAGKISHSAQQWKLTYKPMVPNKHIEKGEPQNIGSPIGSPLKLVDFTGKGEPGEPGEPKLNPMHAHIHTRACARTQENSVEGGKGSPCSPRPQNLINLDSYKGEPIGEPLEIGSPFVDNNNDEVII
ncbi:MAG: toprim domain-containing protein [Proteobacteria bacterium]|nr:hypothetical protein [Desulfobacula sp.]MBU4133494.1 toprim domain-containing protein [Pseudomonadota bacterium]